MPVTDSSFDWLDGVIALGVIALCAFLVTFITTDLLGIGRRAYVAVLAVISVALLAGYAVVVGLSPSDVVASHWRSGILAGVVAAAAYAPLVQRLPRRSRARGRSMARDLAWEGFVYGIAEAILLAVLPVMAAWHAVTELGGGTPSAVALAAIASGVVVVVHHLGYREFRGRAARRKLVGAVVACGAQALAFAVTGSILAPAIAHVVLHAQLIFRGIELPPASEPADAAPIGTWRPQSEPSVAGRASAAA